MDEEADIYNQDLENRILKIVEKILKQRNRPCFQNIHSFLTRGGVKIQKSELKVFINSLVMKGVLINKGNDEKESFRLGNIPPVDESELSRLESPPPKPMCWQRIMSMLTKYPLTTISVPQKTRILNILKKSMIFYQQTLLTVILTSRFLKL